MFQKLTEQEFLSLTQQSKRIAVYCEVAADQLTPINIFLTLKTEMKEGSMLESGLQHEDMGRYSFFGIDVETEFSSKESVVTIQRGHQKQRIPTSDPLQALRNLLPECRCATLHGTPHLVGGAVGFITYDAVRLFEAIPDRHIDQQLLPDLLFRFYRTSLTFDHHTQRLTINRIVNCGENPISDYHDAIKYIENLLAKIKTIHTAEQKLNKDARALRIDTIPDLTDDEFKACVLRTKEYIKAGDAFQIVVSRSFTAKFDMDPFTLYRALRFISHSPYMFYINYGNKVILGASPERLVKVYKGKVSVNPIAGTRPRYLNGKPVDLSENLLNDKKEVAEHMMLVDLARNDVGAVSTPGSVKVEELMKVKYFPQVIHLVSVVSGKLAPEHDALSALRATFPAGTLSGAPKIRAMEIIDELENSRRGMYGGGIITIDNEGNLDASIAIRMAVVEPGKITVRSGAGIVMDSDPQAEADETRHKASTILNAIAFAEENL